MYRRMKALQKTCLMKKMNWKKRSFYSNELWLCSPAPGTALPHSSVSRKLGLLGIFSHHRENGLYLTTYTSIYQFDVTTVFKFLSCLFFPNLYQGCIRRIILKRTILTLSICYRVYIVLTLKPDWLLFNILLSNIKILSFFLKDEIQ